MKLNYYKETDSLYIDLSSRPAVDNREVSEGIVLDYDDEGHLTGIDIEHASKNLELKEIVLNKLPSKILTTADSKK